MTSGSGTGGESAASGKREAAAPWNNGAKVLESVHKTIDYGNGECPGCVSRAIQAVSPRDQCRQAGTWCHCTKPPRATVTSIATPQQGQVARLTFILTAASGQPEIPLTTPMCTSQLCAYPPRIATPAGVQAGSAAHSYSVYRKRMSESGAWYRRIFMSCLPAQMTGSW
jgi:hypothetical protein